MGKHSTGSLYSKVEKKIGNNGVVNPVRNRQAPTEGHGQKKKLQIYSFLVEDEKAAVTAGRRQGSL
jgi:hypothetical protein